MDFRRGIRRDEPEINFIPLIDLLLVILIFLMVTTTYSRFTELQVNLPTAGAEQAAERPAEIIVAVSADARYLIDNNPLSFGSATSFGQAPQQAPLEGLPPLLEHCRYAHGRRSGEPGDQRAPEAGDCAAKVTLARPARRAASSTFTTD